MEGTCLDGTHVMVVLVRIQVNNKDVFWFDESQVGIGCELER
jgi:hypothetical protein